jgi:hypothetical protein
MRQIIAEDGGTWVERLARGVRLLNDTPGSTGLSPYEICFGRHRSLATLPITISKPCEDAKAFFKKRREMDLEIAQKITETQKKRADQTNKGRIEHPPLTVGAKVWYKPETQPGHDKTDTTWIGPGKVRQRVGEHSYVVKVKPGVETEVHRSQLRPHIEDEYCEKSHPLYYFSGKAPEVAISPDQWEVHDILEHRVNPKGDIEFKVKWEGSDKQTWEPLLNFVTPNEVVMTYCANEKVDFDLITQWKVRPQKASE